MSKHFTETMEQHFKNYIDNKDEVLFHTIIHPKLQEIADFLVTYKFTNHKVVCDDANDLINQMVIHTYLNLHKYDANRGKVYTYINRLMTNYVRKLFQHHRMQKRDYTLKMYLHDYTHNAEGEEIREIPTPSKTYNIYKDKLFYDFYCQWWKNNIKLAGKAYADTILSIINVLEDTDRAEGMHPVNYLARRHNISRQTIYNCFRYMRKFNNRIIKDYNHSSIWSFLLPSY